MRCEYPEICSHMRVSESVIPPMAVPNPLVAHREDGDRGQRCGLPIAPEDLAHLAAHLDVATSGDGELLTLICRRKDELGQPLLESQAARVRRVAIKVAADGDTVLARVEGLPSDGLTLCDLADVENVRCLSERERSVSSRSASLDAACMQQAGGSMPLAAYRS